jgi:hypothetical protein
MKRFPRRASTLLPVAAAVAALLSSSALAQSAPPAGSPSDVRYTPVTGTSSPLFPRSPDVDGQSALIRGDPSAKPGGFDYAANAAVGRITVDVDRDDVPADGQSPVKVVVRLFDKQGAPLKSAAFLTIEHSGGRILLPGARTDELGPRRQDADRTVPGVQLKVEGGVATFTLLAPFEAQDVRLRITAGTEEASGTISFVPELRPMVAAGLVEGIVNFRNRTTLSPVRTGDVFEREIQSWSREFNGGKSNVAARTAFYLKGTIRGDLLLTAAYDSDKDTRTRLLRDIRPDELYPVYGDASIRSFDARSTERLYVRLDRNKDYVLYGDFVTGDGFTQPIGQGAVASLKQRSLGNYNRTATGIRAHKEDDRLTASAFAFHDSLRQVVEEFASQGSGPYGLRNNAVLEGSEKIEVIVRDRQNSSRIVSVRPLVRLVDYSFEPFSGRILLATFLPSADENLNPVSLRVTYEVDQGGEKFWVYGGDAQVKLSPEIELGGSAVNDTNELARYKLYSANATWKIGPKTALVVEVARSETEINTNPTNVSTTPALAGRVGDVGGQAWRVEFAHEGEKIEARAFLGRSDPEFNNPAAPLNAGRGEGQANASYQVAETVKVYGEAAMSEDRNPGGGERKIGGAGIRWAATDRLTVDVGLRAARETIGTQGNGVSSTPFGSTLGLTGSIATGAGGGALGYGNQPLDPVTGLPIITPSTGLAPAVSNLAPGTHLESNTARIGIGYKLTDKIRLGGEVEHDVSGDARRRYALGADYQVNERTKLYARYERQEGWAFLQGVTTTGQSANAFILGVDSTYLKDTQVFSEYRLRDAVSDRDLQLASGIRNFWDVQEGLRLTTALEHVSVMSGSTAPSNAASIGADYTADPLWRASTRVEVRRSGDIAGTTAINEKFTTVLGQALLARKLSRDWTLLARDYLLKTDYVDRGDIVQNRAQLGVAYRDTDTNRINALAKVEWKDERDASNASVGELKSKALILSAHADWHPSRPWWMTGRIAGKWQRDQFEQGVQSSFNAQLLAGRVVYDVTENWDLGLLAAVQTGQSGARQYATGAEVGYLLQQNLWLSAGFNVSGFKGDNDLTGYEYVQRGFYLRLRFKFDETLLLGRDKAVNPSLDR